MALIFVLCPEPLEPVGLVSVTFRPTLLYIYSKKLLNTNSKRLWSWKQYITVVDTWNYPKLQTVLNLNFYYNNM